MDVMTDWLVTDVLLLIIAILGLSSALRISKLEKRIEELERRK
jgi:hypothetical protein